MHKAPQVLASSGSEEGSSPGEFDSEEEEGVCHLQAMVSHCGRERKGEGERGDGE